MMMFSSSPVVRRLEITLLIMLLTKHNADHDCVDGFLMVRPFSQLVPSSSMKSPSPREALTHKYSSSSTLTSINVRVKSNHRRSFFPQFLSQSSSSSIEEENPKSNEQHEMKSQEQQQQQRPQNQYQQDETNSGTISSSHPQSATMLNQDSILSPPSSSLSKQEDLFNQAVILREKAQQLLTEANQEEVQLRLIQLTKRNDYNSILDEIIQKLFAMKSRNTIDLEESLFIQQIVAFLQEEKYSTSKLLNVIERIHEREMNVKRIFMGNATNPYYTATTIKSQNTTSTTTGAGAAAITEPNKSFIIGDLTNSNKYKQDELLQLQGWIETIIRAQSIIDDGHSASTPTKLSSSTGTATTASLSSLPSYRMKRKWNELKKEEDKLYQKQLAENVNQGLINNSKNNNQDISVQGYIKQTLNNNNDDGNTEQQNNVTIKIDGKPITGSYFNITNLLSEISQTPLWVPSSILPYLIVAQDELQSEDLKAIKNKVLSGSLFQCTSWDSTKFAAIYRGNFVEKRRSISMNALSGVKNAYGEGQNEQDDKDVGKCISEIVFRDIQKRLEKEELMNKVQLFLIEDPEWRQDPLQRQPQPVLLAVSSVVVPDQDRNRGKAAKALIGFSIISTILTSFAFAISSYALNPNFFNRLMNESDPRVIVTCIPMVLGIFAISLFHETVHFYIAKKKKVKLGLPVPLPSFQIGTFGNITPLRSFPQSRTALFDIALGGPLITSMVSTALLVLGILLTINAPAESIPNLAVVPAALMKMSFLVGSITSILAPKVMMLPSPQPIPIHPLFLVGFVGLVSSALNMLPIGRLDGGRTCNAVFGRRPAYIISLVALSIMAITALNGLSTISIFWGLLITLFQRNADVPIRDELSKVNDFRVGVYAFSMIVTVLTLVPFPSGIL